MECAENHRTGHLLHDYFRIADHTETAPRFILCTVKDLAKSHRILKTIWTLVAIVSAIAVLLDVLGTAAWNGVNFAIVVYLFVSSAGVLALVASLCPPCLRKAVFRWIIWSGAVGIACMGLVFIAGFVFGRDPSVPWNSALKIGAIKIPYLAFYGFVIVSCLIQAVVQFPNRQLKGAEDAGNRSL